MLKVPPTFVVLICRVGELMSMSWCRGKRKLVVLICRVDECVWCRGKRKLVVLSCRADECVLV